MFGREKMSLESLCLCILCIYADDVPCFITEGGDHFRRRAADTAGKSEVCVYVGHLKHLPQTERPAIQSTNRPTLA